MSAQERPLEREYVCPECGYDGFRAGKPTGTIDFNIQWSCPVCMTNIGRCIWLVEKTDPRSAG